MNVERSAPSDGQLPAGPHIILATLDNLKSFDSSIENSNSAVLGVEFVDRQGFACLPIERAGTSHMLVAARSSRGVFNGATWIRDMCIDGDKNKMVLEAMAVLRTPRMEARGAYCLTMYGQATQYTVEHWGKIFESFASDGMDRVYFWVSGMFPSKKFPQTFDVDASKGTVIRTVEQIQEIIRKAHDLGLKLYLGTGVFAWSTAHYLGDGLPKGAMATDAFGLCPAWPEVRQRHKEYFMEMIDALPEADGFFFELRDEQGECKCKLCRPPVDKFGSRRYGQHEISFVQEFARDVWRKYPHVNFSVNVGYAEHKDDVAFYQAIGKMCDPRFEWLDCRWSWTYPSIVEDRLPGVYFSRQMIHWDPFYTTGLDQMINMADKVAREGYCGYVPAFEPGFATADYYGHAIPYPTDVLNYAVTGFAYRELTWDPVLAGKDLKQRIHRRFFGSEAPSYMGEDLCYLRDFIVTYAKHITRFSQDWIGWKTERNPHPVLADLVDEYLNAAEYVEPPGSMGVTLPDRVRNLITIRDQGLPRLTEIENHMKQAGKTATPKTLETLEQMQSLIDDTRKHFAAAVPEPAALDGYLKQLEAKKR